MTNSKENNLICFLAAGDTCVVEFLDELREITWKNKSKGYIADAIFYDELHGQCEAFATSHTILVKKLRRYGKLKGRTFEIENKGKENGKNYYNYKVTELKQTKIDNSDTNE